MGIAGYRAPKIKILYNGVDKTDMIPWIDINIDDYESDESDVLNVLMHWSAPLPREEDEIKIYIDGAFLGDFTIATIKYNYKQSYEIEAISANFFKSFREKKNRTFKAQSYEQILRSIAKENGYNIKIDFNRMDEVGDIEQYDLSDCAFCKKIADDLEITFCVKNKTLIFIDKDKDHDRVEYTITEDEIIDLNYQINHTKKYNACEIKWFDSEKNKSVVSKVGVGTPVLKFSDFARDEAEALSKAEAKLKRQKNSVLAGTVSIHGRPFFAGGFINIKLKDEPKTLRAIISKITHSINNNWLSTIEFF